jgi:hypothetical protein
MAPQSAIILALFGIALVTSRGDLEAARRVIDLKDLKVLHGAADVTVVPDRTDGPLHFEVSLICRVSESGKLRNCRVAEERPRGWHAGLIALRMAKGVRVSTTSKHGANVVGSLVRIPFTFQ